MDFGDRAARVGVITGTGGHELDELEGGEELEVPTPFGEARVVRGRIGEIEVIHLSRHGAGHARLSSQVDHLANVAALRELGAEAVIATTICGAVDPSLELGGLLVFDDLHFPSNRLPDGSLCSFYRWPGDPERGHWIYERPYSQGLREALLAGASQAATPARDGGCYGHVDGPRFNTAAEIRALALCGVSAISQTAGPEAVLCGECELPYALIGYVTDYANGIGDRPTPKEELLTLMERSRGVLASVIGAAVPLVAQAEPQPAGFVYRFERQAAVILGS